MYVRACVAIHEYVRATYPTLTHIYTCTEVKRRLSSLELDAAFRDIALAVRGANSEMIRDLSAAFSFLRHPKGNALVDLMN